jgi:hypothetical protein
MSARRSGAGVGVLDGLLYSVGGHDGPSVSLYLKNIRSLNVTVITMVRFEKASRSMTLTSDSGPQYVT